MKLNLILSHPNWEVMMRDLRREIFEVQDSPLPSIPKVELISSIEDTSLKGLYVKLLSSDLWQSCLNADLAVCDSVDIVIEDTQYWIHLKGSNLEGIAKVGSDEFDGTPSIHGTKIKLCQIKPGSSIPNLDGKFLSQFKEFKIESIELTKGNFSLVTKLEHL